MSNQSSAAMTGLSTDFRLAENQLIDPENDYVRWNAETEAAIAALDIERYAKAKARLREMHDRIAIARLAHALHGLALARSECVGLERHYNQHPPAGHGVTGVMIAGLPTDLAVARNRVDGFERALKEIQRELNK